MKGIVTGLAVGGLGGFNAHDAGVLKAAHDCDLGPDIITCTSGGMYWVYQYLRDPEGIPAKVEEQAAKVEGESTFSALLGGVPGIASPAYVKYLMRWWKPWKELSQRELLNRLVPAQVAEFRIPAAELELMADTFNATAIPVIFNAYAIAAGRELAFGNDAALKFLNVTEKHVENHCILGAELATEYRRIDAAAVKSALWIVLYGFDNQYDGECVIDGAYHRQVLLNELAGCRLVYVVKPQSNAWQGSPPENYLEVQDFNTEMWFNASLASEIACIQMKSAGRPLRIECITMDRPLGYMNYLQERMRTYHEGYHKGTAVFRAEEELNLDDDPTGCTIDLRDLALARRPPSRTTPAPSRAG